MCSCLKLVEILTFGCTCILLQPLSVTCEEPEPLKWTLTESRLPYGFWYHSAVYDGGDAIYVVLGYNGSYNDQVFKYTLSSGTVEAKGEFVEGSGGATALFGENIYNVGGRADAGHNSRISSYSIGAGQYELVNNLPTARGYLSSAWDPVNNLLYVFGGRTNSESSLDTIVQYDTKTNRIETVGARLPVGSDTATAVWSTSDSSAYIFGGWDTWEVPSADIVHFNPATNSAIKLPTRLPKALNRACSVYDSRNDYAYILPSSRSLIRFDPITQTAEEVVIDSTSWPASLAKAACVYVHELARIYVFAGYGYFSAGSGNRYLNEISYIQLPLMEEEPTTTESPSCPPTGVHTFPYPGNCTLYIKCFDGLEQILSCAPLVFDKIDLLCKPEGEAICDEEDPPVRCPPSGYEAIPHPTNCSLYYECLNGNSYESECAGHTYFDANPAVLRCNQAELALCHAECPATGIEFQPIRNAGCKWYKVCLEGASANLECGDGMAFSPLELKCVDAGEFICPYGYNILNIE